MCLGKVDLQDKAKEKVNGPTIYISTFSGPIKAFVGKACEFCGLSETNRTWSLASDAASWMLLMKSGEEGNVFAYACAGKLE